MKTTTVSTRRGFTKFIRQPEQYPLQLRERDLNILKLIYDHRFLASDHVTSLISGSERKILQRLQKLYHQGYVDRLCDRQIRSRSGSEKMVYAITGRAAELLAGELGLHITKVNWLSKNRSAGDRHIKHCLMVNNLKTVLTLALAGQEGASLVFWRENRGSGRNISRELFDKVTISLREGREEQGTIIPDAFFKVEDPEYEHFFYLEADRSTMASERFLIKLRAYWQWWKQGGSQRKHQVENFRVLTITKSKERRDNLREVAMDASPGKGGSGMFWFACEKDYTIEKPASILEPIWITPKDDLLHSLLE